MKRVTSVQMWVMCVATFVLAANIGLTLDGCCSTVKPPAATAPAGTPADPTDVLNNPNATIDDLKKAIKDSKAETKQLKDKYDAAIEEAIIAKLWWAFGICCLAMVACGAAAWFLPLFRGKAIQGIVFSGVAASLCIVLMKLVPHMWQIAWGVALLAIAAIVFYLLRHAKGVSTAFAWTSEFAQQVGQDAKVAVQKEQFFVNKLAASKSFDREGLKALRDKALATLKKATVDPTAAKA